MKYVKHYIVPMLLSFSNLFTSETSDRVLRGVGGGVLCLCFQVKVVHHFGEFQGAVHHTPTFSESGWENAAMVP